MGYREDVDDVSGNIPGFGAIFMSNTATKRECMKRGVFGLPLAQADFVKQVKAGMILFLFEFERRQLFGVFRAISDGKINVMPNAFKSSGKNFPAQVQFTPIWNCSPLSEHEFKDAIRDNYYSFKKFKFGLSEDQVHRLLLLFSSRKLKRKLPDRQFKSDSRPINEERRRRDDARILINNRMRPEPDMRDSLCPEILSEHGRDSLERVTGVDHLLHSRGDTRQSKNKIDYDEEQVLQTRTGNSRVKRTRVDSEARFLVNDVAGKAHYDGHSPRQGTWNGYFDESLGARRIVDEEGPFLAGHMLKDEGEMNNNLEPIVARDHTRNSFSGVGVANKDGYQFSEYIHDTGSGLISSEHYDNREAILADADNFLINHFGGRNQHDVDIGRGTIFTEEQPREYQRERAIDSGTYFLNKRNSLGPDMSSEHFGISMGRGTRATDDIRFSVIEKDHESNILAEHPSGIARSSTDLGIYPTRERFKYTLSADTLGLATSNDYSRFDLVEDSRIGGESRFRESDMEETGSQLGSFCGHSNISPSRISKSPYTRNPSLKTEISSPLGKARNSSLFRYPEDRYILHFPGSTSQDATRAVPYDPDVPDICRGHSSATAVGLGSRSVQDLPFYQGSKVSPSSSRMRESSPYQLEPRGSGRYFDTADYGDAHSLPSHNEASYRKLNSSTMNGYSENNEFKTATQEGFNLSFYPDPPAHFPPSKVETTENDGDGPLTNSHFSNTKCGYDAGSRGKYSYTASEGINTEGLASFDVGWGKMQSGASFSEARKDPIDQDNNFCRSHENKVSYINNRRKSVFARLTSAPEARMHDQDDDTDAIDDATDMDTSVENIMATLQHGLSHQVKIRNNKVNLKQPDDKGIANSNKAIMATSDQEFEHSNLKTDQTIEEIGGSILEETRHKDFKRRSKAKMNREGTCNEISAGIPAHKRLVEDANTESLAGKAAVGNAKVDSSPTVSSGKRRRLVRPVFSKKESDEGISCDVTEILHENFVKEKERNHQEATEGCENSNQKTAEAEKSSVNFHPPSCCPEGESRSFQPQEAQNSNITDSCKHKSKCCGWIEF